MPVILIVDDEEPIREVMLGILEDAGYTIRAARDGKEASQFISQGSFDLIVTDLVMPEKEGLELIKEVRRDHPAIRIVAISGAVGNVKETFLSMARAFGADFILAKPFSLEDLLHTVEQALSK
jgi:CheY-like chemotaxis protein